MVSLVMAVTMSMASLALANAQSVLHGDGGQECAESDAETAEHEGVKAGSVRAKGLGLVAPGFVPAAE